MPKVTWEAALPWTRRAYWLTLVLVAVRLATKRAEFIWPGNLSYFDQGLLVFLAVLLALPLFAEIEGFGFSLRRELESTKKSIEERITSLQSVVATSVETRNNLSLNMAGPVLSAEQLSALAEQIAKSSHASSAKAPSDFEATHGIPPDTQFLFSVRYTLERALDGVSPWLPGMGSPSRMVSALRSEGLLSDSDAAAFRQVWAISSRAIHGEDAAPSMIAFVRQAYPVLLDKLLSLPAQFADDD